MDLSIKVSMRKHFDAKLWCCRIEDLIFYLINFTKYTSEDSSTEKFPLGRQQNVQKNPNSKLKLFSIDVYLLISSTSSKSIRSAD